MPISVSNNDQQPKRYRATVVVVDDEENMGKILAKILHMENYKVTTFTDPVAAVEHIRHTPPDLVITDVKMPGMSGTDVLKQAKAARPSTGVVVMTAFGTIEGAIEAMRAGAFDYITKPFKTDELLLTLAKANEHSHLIIENERFNETHRRQVGDVELIGESAQLSAVRQMIEKIAPTDSAVLIRGESGTGKELVAKSIHHLSNRRRKRFVAINCASIPENLLESELFGHEKGSFTGADRTKMGLVELAHEGTLFLDEIGDLPHPLQAKLLRVLQEREIQRVGGLQAIPVDIRLVAATNRDLKSAIDSKEFRADLFYRLNVITINLPSLRERPEDLKQLIPHMLERASRKLGRGAVELSPESLHVLERYSYPGNVRELENILERMAVLCEGNRIELVDVPADIFSSTATPALISTPQGQSAMARNLEYKDAKDRFEREYLLSIIETAKGNISEAARISGISRRHFYEKLEKLNIKTDR